MQGESFGGSETPTSSGETPAVGFDSPYVSDLRFLALPGLPTTFATTTTPSDTTTTTATPVAPVGPPPEIVNVHTTALTPFSATIAWRTSVPSSSRIAYGLDAPVIWTAPTVASTEHQATLTSLAFDNSYKLAVTAVNDGGAARVAEFVLTTPGLTGPVQMTTSNGAILLNGQPAFPKLVWAQCPDAVEGNLSVGIDLFMGNGCGSPAALAKWVAGRAFVLADAQTDASGRAGTVGTHLPDELRLVPPTPGSGLRFLT